MNKQELETILKENFQDNFRIEVDYTIDKKQELIKVYWLDGTPASTIEDILKNKTDSKFIFLFRKFSNAYILEKFEILTKEFKFLNNTLKKLKKENEAGVVFDKGLGNSYSAVNRTIKNRFQYASLFKDKNPGSVACLINFYFKY